MKYFPILYFLIISSIHANRHHLTFKENNKVILAQIDIENKTIHKILELSKYIGKEKYYTLSISPDEQILSITGHISKQSRYYTIKLIDIRNDKLIKEFQPGYAGRITWFGNNKFFYSWGCGSPCVIYRLYNLNGKILYYNSDGARTPLISFDYKYFIHDMYFDFSIYKVNYSIIKKISIDPSNEIFWCLNRNVLAIVKPTEVYLFDADNNLEGSMALDPSFTNEGNIFVFYSNYLFSIHKDDRIMGYNLNTTKPITIKERKQTSFSNNLITNKSIILDLENLIYYKIPKDILKNYNMIFYDSLYENYDFKVQYLKNYIIYSNQSKTKLYYFDPSIESIVQIYSSENGMSNIELK